jgi:hypothetical protein
VHSSPASYHFLPLRYRYSPQHPVLKHPQCVLPLVWQTQFHTHTELQVTLWFCKFRTSSFLERRHITIWIQSWDRNRSFIGLTSCRGGAGEQQQWYTWLAAASVDWSAHLCLADETVLEVAH